MELVFNLIVVLHFLGLASLVGGFLVQMKSSAKGVNPAMWHGALVQLVTGLALVGLVESGAYDGYGEIDTAKITVKLAFTVIITVLAFIGRKSRPLRLLFGEPLAHCRSQIFLLPFCGPEPRLKRYSPL